MGGWPGDAPRAPGSVGEAMSLCWDQYLWTQSRPAMVARLEEWDTLLQCESAKVANLEGQRISRSSGRKVAQGRGPKCVDKFFQQVAGIWCAQRAQAALFPAAPVMPARAVRWGPVHV